MRQDNNMLQHIVTTCKSKSDISRDRILSNGKIACSLVGKKRIHVATTIIYAIVLRLLKRSHNAPHALSSDFHQLVITYRNATWRIANRKVTKPSSQIWFCNWFFSMRSGTTPNNYAEFTKESRFSFTRREICIPRLYSIKGWSKRGSLYDTVIFVKNGTQMSS